MWVLPLPLLITIILGLLSFMGLLWSVWFLFRLWNTRRDRRGMPERRLLPRERSLLALACLIILFSVLGRPLVMALGGGSGQDSPQHRKADTGTFLTAPDGTRLYVETAGRADGPTIVFTHGWGADLDMWQYARRDLANDYRLIAWDLPGLGSSHQPPDRNYSLDRMAEDLRAVVSTTPGPVILVGHSIGGMINLTFGRRYPDLLGSKVKGIVEMNTTYTNPTRTASGASVNQALQKPVAEPILHAMIALSPLVRVVNTLRYWNGLSHLQYSMQGFAGTQTAGQVDFVSHYEMLSSPAVVARGTLGMFHWDATDALAKITVPVLIIAADRDSTTLPSASEYMKQTLPHAELLMAKPGKHIALIERNREYDQAVRDFANKCFGTAVVSSTAAVPPTAPQAR